MALHTLRSSARSAISKGEREAFPSRLDVSSNLISKPTLSELLRNVISGPSLTYAEVLESLYVLEACLRDQKSKDGFEEGEFDGLCGWVLDVIVPKPNLTDDGGEKVESAKALSLNLKLFLALSSLGTSFLKILDELLPLSNYSNPAKLTIGLAAFTDRRDPWTAEASFENATSLLSKYHVLASRSDILIEHIFRRLIRPLFVKAKHPAITPLGRKAIQPTMRKLDFLNETENKPWRFDQIHSLTVFRWALQNLEEHLLEENWPLIIPPLLTLIDDDLTQAKAKGCELLTILLNTTPPALLKRTGLGEVLNDAVMPCLSYLPSLTPEIGSLCLLREAYPALVTLARVRYPTEEKRKERMKMLDQVFRTGVLGGYFHCGENPKIVECLVEQTSVLVEEMGVWSSRHLKDLIPLLSDVLAVPFGMAYPQLLLAAARTLQKVILIDWPRIAGYRAEILRGLAFCWLRIMEDESEEQSFPDLKGAVRGTMRLLKAAVQSEVDINADIDTIIKGDERLGSLMI